MNSIEKIFNLAVKNHQEGKTGIAQELYNQVLKIDPNHSQTLNNIAVIFTNSKDYQKAISSYEKAIEIDPTYAAANNNLGNTYKKLGEYQKALSCFEKAIKANPNYIDAYNNQGNTYKELGEYQKALSCYDKAIELNPNYTDAYYNQGNTYKKLGENQKAKEYYDKVIKLNPNYIDAYFNQGNTYNELGEYQKAKECYEKVIELDPNNTNAYWNMYAHALNIDEALITLNKLYKIDKNHTETRIMIAALHGYKGDFKYFDELLNSSDANHPHTRSIKWVFSLPKLPKIFFNRWNFFDTVVKLSTNTRPFYEFGVWYGLSFQYLINTFKKGFGFDTFTGLPDAWDNHPKGTFSNFGKVPKIKGGEFIVGKFEDTLPDFFSEERPMASLINFDADLYSSTLCALNYSKKVIDEQTILIFDELIMGEDWEIDEFRALNEFCNNLNINYEVLAISFLTRQVAVKLNG